MKRSSGFLSELGCYSSNIWFIIPGSRDWGEEGAVMEEALYREVGPEVEVAESRLETEAQRRGSRWPGAGLCSGAACTSESW